VLASLLFGRDEALHERGDLEVVPGLERGELGFKSSAAALTVEPGRDVLPRLLALGLGLFGLVLVPPLAPFDPLRRDLLDDLRAGAERAKSGEGEGYELGGVEGHGSTRSRWGIIPRESRPRPVASPSSTR